MSGRIGDCGSSALKAFRLKLEIPGGKSQTVSEPSPVNNDLKEGLPLIHAYGPLAPWLAKTGRIGGMELVK